MDDHTWVAGWTVQQVAAWMRGATGPLLDSMGPAAAADAAAKAEAEGIDGGVLLSTDGRCVALNQLGLTKETAMKLASAIEELWSCASWRLHVRRAGATKTPTV